MKYPNWAPQELVDLLPLYEIHKIDFNTVKIDMVSLNELAWKRGLTNWNEFEKLVDFQKAAIDRLITRPEMESVWKWVAKENFDFPLTSLGGLCGDFLMAVNTWYSTPQVPQTERNDDFKEIAKLARNLNVKLQKYHGDLQPINSYMTLFPTHFKEKYQKKYDERDLNNPKQFMLSIDQLASTIPSLPELLKELATSASNNKIDLPLYFPKKITAVNAFRTYLINKMIDKIYSLGSTPPLTIVSKFIGVALDDHSVNPDIVRKSIALKIWRSKSLVSFKVRKISAKY